MDFRELSEVNFGLIIQGTKTVNMYDADIFFPPYDEAIDYLKKHPNASIEDCMQVIPPSDYHRAELAGASVNGSGKTVDYYSLLRKAKEAHELGKLLGKAGQQLEKNKDIDMLKIQGQLQAYVADSLSGGLTKLSDIQYKDFAQFQKSGWDVIDNIFGGIPAAGLLLAFGETGVGKSFWLSKLIKEYLKLYKKKTAAVYTLEMSSEEYSQRSVSMYPELLNAKDRFYISGKARNIDEIVAEVSAKRLDIVGIDFVDWLVTEASEPAYTHVYKMCVELTRILGITVVMLAQPNRDGVKYKKFLTKFDLRWTGMAENSAWQLIGLQMANTLGMEDTKYPTYDDDHYYMINLKQRGGWPKQEGPGAIIIKPQKGKPKWEGEVIKNKLWVPGEYSTKQAVQSRREYGGRRER